MLFRSNDTATTDIYTAFYTLSLHDALPILAIAGLPLTHAWFRVFRAFAIAESYGCAAKISGADPSTTIVSDIRLSVRKYAMSSPSIGRADRIGRT